MASFFTDLAKPFVERGINRVIEESRYICCYRCIVEEFEKERVLLKPERKTVGQRVEVATRKGQDIQFNALEWEEKVDGLIETDTKTMQKCFFGLSPNCIWRYRRGKELVDKTKLIKTMVEKGEKLDNVGLPGRLQDVQQYSSQDYIAFKSRELKYTNLLDSLKDKENYIIGLQGMGGTGKSKLAIEVGKELKQSKHFTCVIFTTVSYNPDIKKIQDEIAGPLGLVWEDCTESNRVAKLWSRLTNGENILVILDDVWDGEPPLNFDAIGIPKQDNHKGCRVLVTTRNKQVLNNMDCDRIIELELLSEEEAWIMFKRYARIDKNILPKSLIEKGRKIARECKGLPVAITVIAGSLRGQQHRPHTWNVTLDSLKNPIPMYGVDEDVVGIYKCLKSSYDNMRDEKCKGLFLLCSLFREDEEISIETLARLGIGVGLFGEDYGSYDRARSQVVKAKDKLLDSCLLLEAGEEYVKLHDLVRDAAQWIAKQEIRAINLSHKDQTSLVERENNTTKYMFCEGNLTDMFPSKLGGSNLEIMIFFFYMDENCNFVEVANPLFENNIASVRALHLSNTTQRSRYRPDLSLPQSIQSLTNIRSLLVNNVNLGDISALGNLQSLESLDLVCCTIHELPLKIAKLQNFKLLRLEECKIIRNNPFEVISGCSSLEEMYFVDSFNEDCEEITFPMLQRYHVFGSQSELYTKNKSPSKCVVFNGFNDPGFFSESTFKYCMQTVEVVWLIQIDRGWKNFVPEVVPIGEDTNDLVELGLSCISELQCLIDTIDYHRVPNVFSKLVLLNLHNMEKLKELCNGLLSFDSLKSLEELEIYQCDNLQSLFKCKLNLYTLKLVKLGHCRMLVSLFQLSTSQSLVSLEELEIKDCERLENIITVDDEKKENESIVVGNDKDSKSHISAFRKLRSLFISDCPQLECVIPFLSAHDLPVLETINVGDCDGVKYIFGKNIELGSLVNIFLFKLPNFIDIFREYYPVSSSDKRLSSASRDGSNPQTQSDPIKCNCFSSTQICCFGQKHSRHKSKTTTSTKQSEDQSHDCTTALESNSYIWQRAQCLSKHLSILCNTKEIYLRGIPKIKLVFTLSTTSRMLETLTVKNCRELKHILVDTGDDNGDNNWSNVFPNLKELNVEDCGQLEYIFGHYASDHQNDNEIHINLLALKCLYLSGLPSLIAMSPKKYHTTFPHLTEFGVNRCSRVAISVVDFSKPSVSTSLDSRTIKEPSENVEQVCMLERVQVEYINVENIFCLYEINEKPARLELQNRLMPEMTYISPCPKNSFSLQNLISLKIVGCEKLETIFSIPIIKCLPQLVALSIEECNELKNIIEDDDMENQKISTAHSIGTCFPKLNVIFVVKCNKLKCVFSVPSSKRLPDLKVLMIRNAEKLEEIFRSEDGHKVVEIPNLKVVAFFNLPSLCQTQEIQFHTVKNRFVRNCQNLSLTSTSTSDKIVMDEIMNLDIGYNLGIYLYSLFGPLIENFHTQDTSNENPTAETTGNEVQAASIASSQDFKKYFEKGTTSSTHLASIGSSSVPLITSELKTSSHDDGNVQIAIPSTSMATEEYFPAASEVEAVSRHECTSSQTKAKQALGTKHGSVENVASLKVPTIAILPTNSEDLLLEQCLMNQTYPLAETDSTIKPSQGDNNLREAEHKSIQESATLDKKSSEKRNEPPIQFVAPKQKRNDEEGTTHSEAISSPASKCKTSLEDDGEGQIAVPSFSTSMEDFHARVSKKSIETQSQGDSSQAEDLDSHSILTQELVQLVLKKHVESENLSLLSDFLVKHPSVCLIDSSLSNRYKGYAYNCLAELLKFLQTHSVLDVLGSNRSEFVELLQDARRFNFNKEWLDSVERRALFSDIQFPQDQEAVLQKLLESKCILTQHVEDLRHQLASSEAFLESVIQKEEQVLEARVALNAPIGY